MFFGKRSGFERKVLRKKFKKSFRKRLTFEIKIFFMELFPKEEGALNEAQCSLKITLCDRAKFCRSILYKISSLQQ